MINCMNKQKGVSLYLSVVIMVILLAIVLGISTILLGQLKMIRGMENSVIAFYAADTGVERVLYEDKMCRQQLSTIFPPACDDSSCGDDSDGDGSCDGVPTNYDSGEVDLGNGARYRVEAIIDGFQSVGFYKGTRRAIEVNR